MRTISSACMLLLLSGCACLTQPPSPEKPPGRPFDEAEALLGRGNFSEARDAYDRIARTETGSPVGDEASYRAARVLVSSGNPTRNYALAAGEFETYLRQYPSGRFAEDAEAWLAAIGAIQQSAVEKLLEQADSLTKRLETMAADLRQTGSERDAAFRERDAVRAERDDLKKRIESLLQEKDELLRTKAALLQERDGLAKDKNALEKKVAALAKDKENLSAAKAKLDKRLRDVTAVDVKMEKERKKTK